MAAGVAVVASGVGGLPWMVEHGSTGFLCDPHHPGELVDCLRRVLEDPLLRDRLGRSARQRAERQFRLSAVVERTIDVYQRALRSRRSSPSP